MTHSSTIPPQQLVTFTTGEYCLGLDVMEVQEVLKHQIMTAVPLAPREVQGLINLRGHIVTAIDMRRRLHLDPAQDEKSQMNLIVSLRDGSASLVVDAVGDVINLEPEKYKARPSTLVSPLKDMVTGVYQLGNKLLLHIDAEAACALHEEE